ncbi:hypothetical protein ACFVYG_20235 [Streptomyces sp. NPDC058256]|uniref:hypothetical protein n=1 Tax=Streptomyces sp. NPDC058256 TaxID=3346408 RepID=UPI0036ECE0B9
MPTATDGSFNLMIDSVISGKLRRTTLDLPSAQVLIDMFGTEQWIAHVTPTFVDRTLTAVRLTSSDGEEADVDKPNLDDPGSWPQWLSDLITDHRPAPFGTEQQLAAALLAGLLKEAKERDTNIDDDGRAMLDPLDETAPNNVLRALDESGLLTGPLLRAAKEVLTHLDKRAYRMLGGTQGCLSRHRDVPLHPPLWGTPFRKRCRWRSGLRPRRGHRRTGEVS